jgi:hypothetical protein
MAKQSARAVTLRPATVGMLAAVLLSVSVVLAACDRDEDDGAVSCDDVSEHVERICGEGLGSVMAASLRYDCVTFGNTAEAKRCVLAADRCDDDSLGACDIHNRSWGCTQGSGTADCPPGLACNDEEEESECIECRADGECNAGKLCVSNWCVRDSDQNRQLQGLLDGG